MSAPSASPPPRQGVDSPRWAGGASWVLFGVAAASAYARLYFGLDFRDGSLFAALPYTFVLGHRPFLDELTVHQLGSLVMVPPVAAYLGFAQSNEGLVLFMRHLHFLATLLGAASVVRCFGPIVGRPTARMMACLVLLFVPAAIASLGYNSIAQLGVLAGLMLLVAASRSARPSLEVFAGTSLLAWSTFGYPTLLIATGPALVMTLALRRRAEPRGALGPALVSAAVAGGIVAIVSAGTAAYAGLASISTMLDLSSALGTQGGGWTKVRTLGVTALISVPVLAGAALCFAVAHAGLHTARFPRAGLVAVGLLGPDLIVADALSPIPGSPAPMVLWVMSGAGVALLVARRSDLDPRTRLELSVIMGTSLLATAAIGWSTAMGFTRASTGLLPAGLTFLALLALPRAAERPADPDRVKRFAVLMASLVLFFVWERWAYVYADAPVRELTEWVERGPYRGIRTSETHARLIRELTADIEALRGDAETILVHDEFPAGYLLSDLRPRTGALWMFAWQRFISYGNRPTRDIYAAAIAQGPPPDLIVEMITIPIGFEKNVRSKANDPVRRLLPPSTHPVVLERDRYVIRRAAALDGG